MERKLRYGQIGGTLGAFIGGVHRKAIAFNEQAELVAGCFSASNPENNRKCAEHFGISPDRTYDDYLSMAEAEGARTEDRLDFVMISTPNRFHYEEIKAFIERGFHIICEKPLCYTLEQAEEICKLAKEKDVLFCIPYTYVGFNMVKQAKQLIEDGVIGEVFDVKAEYLQEWLLDEVSGCEGEKSLSTWRMDPYLSGISNCVGDIGSHIEQTVAYMTGLRIKRLAAMLDYFDHELDLNANMLVEFDNGAHGTFSCSQVTAGYYNGLNIRIFGSLGAIEWREEHPDFLTLTLKGQPPQILTRGAHTSGNALRNNHLPSGHPEGLTTAFSNIHKAFEDALIRRLDGKPNDGKWDLDFPDAEDGLLGVKFIYASVESSKKDACWVEIR